MCVLLAALIGCSKREPPQPIAAPEKIAEVAHSEKIAGANPAALAPAPAKLPAVSEKGNPPAKAERAPLLEGWPRPQLAFFITGQQMGYIEPCGCTGLANQKGGLARRDSFLKELREKGWPVVPLDVGNQVKRYGKQSAIKFARTAEGLREMQYRAVALGADDLKTPAGDLVAATNPDDKPSMFTSTNVAVLARDLQPQFQVVEAGGKKIGITSVLGDSFQQKLAGDELVHGPALAALQATAAELEKLNCDWLVLLAHASLDETKSLAKAAPIFDLVVSSGGVGEPTLELEKIAGTKSLLAQVGTKGMFVGIVGVFAAGKQPLRYERVPLDNRFPDSPAMLKLLADYQAELQSLGLDGLEIKPLPHPSGNRFVGTAKCGECHTQALAVFEKTPHAHATDSLVKPPNERSAIARHYDPECLSCHVTGWEPQKFFPYESGYLSLDKTPLLAHNGCENCHGPGSAHAAAESGETNVAAAELIRLRDSLKLPLAGGIAEQKCVECHDHDNSPDFHVKGAFEKYWKQVEHVGKD